ELRELRQLREENRKLKTLVADLTLDKHILQEVLSKKVKARGASRTGTSHTTKSPVERKACLRANWDHALDQPLPQPPRSTNGAADAYTGTSGQQSALWIQATRGVAAPGGLGGECEEGLPVVSRRRLAGKNEETWQARCTRAGSFGGGKSRESTLEYGLRE